MFGLIFINKLKNICLTNFDTACAINNNKYIDTLIRLIECERMINGSLT